jgi:quercetin dioxygenase-like cupin family protein
MIQRAQRRARPPDRIEEAELQTWDIRSLEVQPHHPEVLHSDREGRAIAINLPAGEELQEHQTHEAAFLFVSDGEVEIAQGGETITGGPGFLAHFEENERREVRAKSDSLIVLVLNPWPGEGHPSLRHEGG